MTTIQPSRYDLDVNVFLDSFAYEVMERITFRLAAATSELVFHGVGLEIISAVADHTNAFTSLEFNDADQTLILIFDAILPAGSHILDISLTGSIDENLHGLYRSSYNHAGKESWLALTQFEAVHAREAFVCIDEPAAKAVFSIAITADKAFLVLSNANEISSQATQGSRIKHTFAATPVMSTYLVAFIIGELESVSAMSQHGVMINAYATPDKTEQLRFALDMAVRSLDFFDDYFAIPYPLPKLDMVAIPDFAFGAMENWGLITYRETALLLDPANASLGNRQRVVEVVAHELAHQWFGNLVTMAWWNDLWLNEGFASWIEVLAQDHLFPEWQVWTQFVSGHYAYAMELDGLASTHPIEVEVEDPRALDEIFDIVSYSKGAAIIHMLQTYLGAEAFRNGLRAYLKNFSYQNAVTADLWRALEMTSGEPVSHIMTAWTSQPGYPLITLSQADDHLKIKQQRYLASPLEVSVAGKERWRWPLPLRLITSDKTETALLIEANTTTVKLEGVKLLKANAGQSAFLRISYDAPAIRRLLPMMERQDMSVIDRFGIISDLYATAQSGLTSSRLALDTTAALRHEPDYTVWQSLSGGFQALVATVEDDNLRDRLNLFGRRLVTTNLNRLGWTAIQDEPYFDTLMRPMVLQQAIEFGDAATVDAAGSRFEDLLEGRGIPADLRPAVYYGVAYAGDAIEFDALLARYRAETIPQERMRLLGALCRFRKPELIDRALALAFSDDVRSQDIIFVLAWCITNRDCRDQAWAFVQRKWPRLLKQFGDGGHMLESVPSYLGQGYASTTSADEIEQFFAAHPHPALTRPVKQAVESIRLKAAWFARDRQVIEAFLIDQLKNR
jgi:puromycin-sensitive aminopeptidase